MLRKYFRKEIVKKNTKTTAQFHMHLLITLSGKNQQSLLKESLVKVKPAFGPGGPTGGRLSPISVA